ncbi:hypothetical protein ACI2LF_29175 [Kribbella sp. NPDC020789]
MIGLSTGERIRLEALLGEPLIAPDPLIGIRQAATVLGMTAEAVRGLLRSGALPRHDGQLSTRVLRLSDVLAWAKSPSRISVAEAAGILGESTTAVHRFTAARLLTWYGGALPLRRSEVEDLRDQREGWLTLAQAAAELHVSPEEVHRLLRTGTLVHTDDVSRPVDRTQLPLSSAS